MSRASTRVFGGLSLLLLLCVAWQSRALGQCMLANPSFELPGSGGAAFAGWNQFGVVGVSTVATHGAAAAKVSSPSTGGWAVSAVWQRLDAEPGARWSASVRVWHSPTRPLTGQSQAILNIEWRDASGALIDYESHTAASASTPPGGVTVFAVQSQAAPAGTAMTHFLLGVLQGPGEPVADVTYDQATFDNLGPPTLDERQWFDFPGDRTLDFSGRTWRVKGQGVYGPGPDPFCNDPGCVWVDGDGCLHLTIRNLDGAWHSSEVALEQPLGYGDYIFTTVGGPDVWHPNAVLGMFLWQYGPCFDPANGWWNPYNEIDVELSRWGQLENEGGQFVVQPVADATCISRFDAPFGAGERTSHAFRWLPDRIEYRSWRGGWQDEAPGNLIHAWTYSGPYLPRPEQPRAHVNFWQFEGPPDVDQEVVIDQFTFWAACADPACVTSSTPRPLPGPAATLQPARPNPFNPRTTIRFSVLVDAAVEVAIFDARGRHVRTLVDGLVAGGDHDIIWDGRDDRGRQLPSGVYRCQLHAGPVTASMPLVLLK